MFSLLQELNSIAEGELLEESWKTGIGALILAAIAAVSSGKTLAADSDALQNLSRDRVEQVVTASKQNYEKVKVEYMQRRGIQSEAQLTRRDLNFIQAKAANVTAVTVNREQQGQQASQSGEQERQTPRGEQGQTNQPQSHVKRTSMGNDW